MALSVVLLAAYSALMRSLRPYGGLTRLSRNPVVNALIMNIEPKRACRTSEGVPITVDINDYHGRIIYIFGNNDFKVSDVCVSLMAGSEVFLDIGANYSTVGLAVAKRSGVEHVHLFEPQPHLADVVGKAIVAAGLGGVVTLHQCGLFDRDAELEMVAPSHHSGMATVMPHGGAFNKVRSLSITVREAESYLKPFVEGRRFGVKIDIEGAEAHVIPQLLGLGGMRFCVFEGALNGDTLRDIFVAAGWRIYGLARSAWRLRFVRIDNAAQWARFHDFVAVPADHAPAAAETSLREMARAVTAA